MDIGEFKKSLDASRIEPSVLSACLAVTDILAKLRYGDGRHLGLPFFYDRINSAHRENLLAALSILSSREDAILEMHGYLEDDLEGQLHLTNEEFRELVTTGLLAHPISGDLVNDPMHHVRIYYSLRENVQHES